MSDDPRTISEEWKRKTAEGWQPEECSVCLGKGFVDEFGRAIGCPYCNGAGKRNAEEAQRKRVATAVLSRIEQEAAFYETYIHSAEWRARADAAKDRAGYRCQVCHSNRRIEAHHRTYERLGHELDSDITVLCDDCHELFHKNRRLQR